MDVLNCVIHVAIIIGFVQGAAIDTSTCNRAKGCMSIPSNCLSNNATSCNAIATWRSQGTTIVFELSTKTDGYVSFGTLENPPGSNKMSPGFITDCIRSSGTISLAHSKNTNYNNAAVSGTQGLTLTSSEYVSGELRCFFTREKSVTNFPTYGGNNSYKVILAYGTVTNGVKNYHSSSGRLASDLAVNFETSTQVTATGSGSSGYKLVKAHACLMIFAWVMFACVAIMLARHYKDMWPGTNVPGFGKPVWFSFHVIFNILATICTILGFIVIFAHKKEWSDLEGEDKVMKCHPYLGTLVTIFSIINPLIGMCRPDPTAPSRWLFNLVHWIFGFSAQVLGLLMIFIGLKLKVSEPIMSNWMLILLLIFVIVYFLVDLILLILRCLPASKARTASEIEMRGAGDATSDNGAPPKPPSAGLRTFLMVVVALFAMIVTLALVIGIGKK